MATSKKRKTFTSAEKAAILAEANDSTVPAVAKLHGLTAQTVYSWRAAKKKKRTAKRAAKQAAAVSNGKASGKTTTRAASLDAVHAQLTDALASVTALRAAFRNVFGVDA